MADVTEDHADVWIVRHGETEWSRSGRHTSRTDLPLTERGEQDGRAVASAFQGVHFDLVLCSPLQRARRTAELAGITDPEIYGDLVEWDYGEYEGPRTAEIARSGRAGRSSATAARGGKSGAIRSGCGAIA